MAHSETANCSGVPDFLNGQSESIQQEERPVQMVSTAPKQKKSLNDHTKDIKIGNFKNLIYESWNYTTKTISEI